jgi:hypothetical protein
MWGHAASGTEKPDSRYSVKKTRKIVSYLIAPSIQKILYYN